MSTTPLTSLPTSTSRGRSVRAVINAAKQLEGGGFDIRRPFPSQQLQQIDPFLLFDHMGPMHSQPHEAIGAPDHPHRGFETITYLKQGSMEHLDSFGHQGKIKTGGFSG
jgi:quercetin 2,3-dioxygenase